MLPAHPNRRVALLQLRGLVQHHDRLRISQVREDEPLQRGQSQACSASSALKENGAEGSLEDGARGRSGGDSDDDSNGSNHHRLTAATGDSA
jgi:hypothetical protein